MKVATVFILRLFSSPLVCRLNYLTGGKAIFFSVSFCVRENFSRENISRGKVEEFLAMRLENFLFFYDLELGGVIIGFYHLIVYCLLVVAAVVSFFVAPNYCELKIDFSLHSSKLLQFFFSFAFLISDPDINLIIFAVVIVVYILISCFLVYISWQLVLGVEFVSRHFKAADNSEVSLKMFLARSSSSSKVPNSLHDWPHLECADSFIGSDANRPVQLIGLSHNDPHRLFNPLVCNSNLHFLDHRFNFQEIQRRRISNIVALIFFILLKSIKKMFKF